MDNKGTFKVISRLASLIIDTYLILLIVKPFTHNIVIISIVFMTYFTVMDLADGNSIGKKLFRIKVWGKKNIVVMGIRSLYKLIYVLPFIYMQLNIYNLPNWLKVFRNINIGVTILYGLMIMYGDVNYFLHDWLVGTYVDHTGDYNYRKSILTMFVKPEVLFEPKIVKDSEVKKENPLADKIYEEDEVKDSEVNYDKMYTNI